MNVVVTGLSQTSSAPPLKSSRISKEYLGGTFKALDDVSFELHENQITAFIGPSGCGKTTMLRIIAGLEYPTRGRLQVFGKNVDGPGPDRGMIFQAYTSFPWLTALQNVEYGMKILGISAQERRERAMSFLKLVHLEKFADSYPRSLSGGMKQRVALARTLAAESRNSPYGRAIRCTRCSGPLGNAGADDRTDRTRKEDGRRDYSRYRRSHLFGRSHHILFAATWTHQSRYPADL